MAIELKSVEDIGKFLDEQNTKLADLEAKLHELGDADGAGRDALKKEIKELRLAVDEAARRRFPMASNETKELVDPAEFAKIGMEAVLKAPTPVERTASGWAEPKGTVARFQDISDNMRLICELLKLTPDQAKQTKYYQQVYAPAYQHAKAEAFDIQTSGEGSEWLAPMYSARLFEKVRLALNVASFFEQFQMPRSTFTFPVQLDDLTATTFAELTGGGTGTTIDDGLGTKTLTGNVTFTGKALASKAFTTKFLEEDSIVPILPFIQMNIVQAVRNGIETAVVNGDNSTTHRDNDINGTTRHAAKVWDGLRYAANAASSEVDAGGNLINTTANFNSYVMQARAGMGVYGVNQADLGIVVSPVGYNQLLQVEAFSTAASLVPGSGTNVQGAFNSFRPYGLQLFVSEMMKENLDATGVNSSGGPNTFTGMLLMNRRGWLLGTVRNITVSVLRELYAEYDQDLVLVTWRGDFEKMYGSSAKTEAFVYDVALS